MTPPRSAPARRPLPCLYAYQPSARFARVRRRDKTDPAKAHLPGPKVLGRHSCAANPDTCHGVKAGAYWVKEASHGERRDEAAPTERWEDFHAMIEGLPWELREIFQMAWHLGLGPESAAKAMGCSARTLGRMWAEAREQVGKAMEKADD
jgi:DNA-directed RNA polymerase specialized sigma24 family protein